MDAVLENRSHHVLLTKRKTDFCAILGAEKDTTGLDQSAGKTAPVILETMEPIARSLLLTVVALVPCTSVTTVKSGALCGIRSAAKITTTSLVASARLTVPPE